MLTADHKRQRVEAAQEFLAFHGTTEEEFLDSIVTGDETWTCNSEQEKRNADKGVRFHHDNARPHTANRTTALVERFGWEMVSHPPYSPDLAPSDFHLFPELKKNLGGTQFQTDEEVQNAVVNFLHGQAAEFYHSGLKKWVPRMQKCIQRNGDYVEK
ncbi:histone-lysine N-methyltransferase SETMAR [Trichonephila clavipes]|nr:histone-lysine N-methyltransferase SETMAR [Trichonephila clavipes]